MAGRKAEADPTGPKRTRGPERNWWALVCDGEWHRLERGKDFDVKAMSVQSSFNQWAHRQGFTTDSIAGFGNGLVHTKIRGDYDQYVWVQVEHVATEAERAKHHPNLRLLRGERKPVGTPRRDLEDQLIEDQLVEDEQAGRSEPADPRDPVFSDDPVAARRAALQAERELGTCPSDLVEARAGASHGSAGHRNRVTVRRTARARDARETR